MSSGQPIAMRDHWWWRPGWSAGRSFYTWHVTFVGHRGMRELAGGYAPMLATLPMLDPVPVRWLHLTMQGLGFTDDVEQSDVDAIVRAARHRLAAFDPFTVMIGPPEVDPEGVPMPVRPAEPLRALRAAVREAIADVWGPDRVPEVAEGWWPHVTLAYSNTAGPIRPIAEALAAQPTRTAEVEIVAVSLISLNRDNLAYEWTDVATVRLK